MFVMKRMFLCKQERQNLLLSIIFLASKVKNPNEGDWKKLQRILNYLQSTQDDVACLSVDDTQTIKWYIDSSFAVHKEMRSHMGAVITLGQGALILDSTKQKVNARSSMESKMVTVNNTIAKLLWTKNLLKLKVTRSRLHYITR
jgi:hypothetical protein